MALLEARDAGHSWLGRSLPHGDRGLNPQQRLTINLAMIVEGLGAVQIRL